jgi:hypothetical protein
MYQANGLIGKILAVDNIGLTMMLNIDSTNFDAFINGSSGPDTPASLSPAGSRNLEFNNSSENVPFQSLNNIGN